MTSGHEFFEQLCALATTGDVSPDKFQQLQGHLLECAQCRASYGDFHAIVEQGFPSLERPAPLWSLPKIGLKRRFIARAAKEGISIEGTGNRPAGVRRILAICTLGILLLVCFGYG